MRHGPTAARIFDYNLVLNGWMTVNDKIGKDVVMAEFKVLPQDLPDVSLETHKKHVWTNDVPAGIKTNL